MNASSTPPNSSTPANSSAPEGEPRVAAPEAPPTSTRHSSASVEAQPTFNDQPLPLDAFATRQRPPRQGWNKALGQIGTALVGNLLIIFGAATLFNFLRIVFQQNFPDALSFIVSLGMTLLLGLAPILVGCRVVISAVQVPQSTANNQR